MLVTTVDGTAHAGTDYTAISQLLDWDAGDGSFRQVTIPIVDRDGANSSPVQFSLHFSNLSSGYTAGSDATVTITPASFPSVAVSSATASETAGTISATITRSGDTTVPVSVYVSTEDGTAVAGTDYTALSPQLVSFGAGATTQTVPITIANRNGVTGNRSFSVVLSSPSPGLATGSNGTMTITSTIVGSTVAFSSATATAQATDSAVTLTLNRTAGTSAESVNISTADGTAVAGTDYTGLSNYTVNFPQNSTSATVSIPILRPSGQQSLKAFSVSIVGQSADVTVGTTSSVTVTITQQDITAPSLTITAPTASQSITAATTYRLTVSGTVADAYGVPTVSLSFNGGAAVATTVYGSSSP